MDNDDMQNPDKMALAEKTPDLKELITEYDNAKTYGSLFSGTEIEDIRFARWPGQTSDGKKHSEEREEGDPAFPFEGASDVRNRLADRTINEVTDLLYTAFARSKVQIGGVELTDSSSAQTATTLMRWVTEVKLRNVLLREAELLGNYAWERGWAVAYVGWDQKLGLRTQTVTLQEIVDIANTVAQTEPNSMLVRLPELILSPEGEDQAAQIIATAVPDKTVRDARKMVRDLRETGQAEVEEEYIQHNLPCVTALLPYDEFVCPQDTIDLQSARVLFRRCYMTEVQVREMANHGWDEEFIEAAIATSGKSDPQALSPGVTRTTALYNSTGSSKLIEILYAYRRQVNANNVPAIYCTVFSKEAGDAVFAKHEMLGYGHGKYPFVEYRSERIRRPIAECRGVPELSRTDQDEIKAQHDSIRDRTSFETLPPIKIIKRVGQPSKVAPGFPLAVTRPEDYTFMEPPARGPDTAFNLINAVERNHSRYFGLHHEELPPVLTAMKQQKQVNNWLATWSEVLNQMFQLCLQYMSDEEIVRVTGAPMPKNLTDVAGQFDFILKFDVMENDLDHVSKKLEAISKFVVPLDTAGVIDRSALVRLILEAIAPETSRQLLIENKSASEAMYRKVQSDIGLMMLGMEPNYQENDPAAETKLQYLQDVVSKNPKAKAGLTQDQMFKSLFENYVKSLQFSTTQQKNAQIGRIGVTPVSDQMAQQQGPGAITEGAQ